MPGKRISALKYRFRAHFVPSVKFSSSGKRHNMVKLAGELPAQPGGLVLP